MEEHLDRSSDTSSPVFATSRSPSPSKAKNGQHEGQVPAGAPRLADPDAEASDLPQLVRTHQTLGYRAGLSDGKDHAEGVQAAFDKGYPLGAELGLMVGWLLRRLAEPDVLVRRDRDAGSDPQKVDTYSYEDAVRELSITNLVAEIEKYGSLQDQAQLLPQEHPGNSSQTPLEEESSVDSHLLSESLLHNLPVLRKWSSIASGDFAAGSTNTV